MYLVSFLILLASYGLYSYYKRSLVPNGLRRIPFVGWSLPIFGHVLYMMNDAQNFMLNCEKNYGKIFEIKLFKRKIVFLSDPTLVEEYFKARETDLSFYGAFNELFLAETLAESEDELFEIMTCLKGSISKAGRMEDIKQTIKVEAKNMVERLREKSKQGPIRILKESNIFTLSTSAYALLGIKLPEEFFELFFEYTHNVSSAIQMTYFIPNWLIRLLTKHRLRFLRHKLSCYYKDIIQSYRDDPTLPSPILRKAVTHVCRNGKHLTDEQIGRLINVLLFTSSENTGQALSNVITYLGEYDEWWEKCRHEANACDSVEDILKSKIITAAIYECVRKTAHCVGGARTPLDKKILGDYYLDDADVVTASGLLLMTSPLQDRYKEPSKFQPERFLEPRNEPMNNLNIITWGAGIHPCPGREFALQELKIAISEIVKAFDIELCEKIPAPNFFTTVLFTRLDLKANLIPT